MGDGLPEDPITQYEAWALEVHECFEALQQAGFTASQAFQLTQAGMQRGWFDTDDDD